MSEDRKLLTLGVEPGSTKIEMILIDAAGCSLGSHLIQHNLRRPRMGHCQHHNQWV